MVRIYTNFYRSNTIESKHYVKALVCDSNGKTLLTTGNNKDLIYPRSAVKIFQAISFIQSNSHKKLNLNKKQIALSCSSHRGEDYHILQLKNWIKKTNLKIDNLGCGLHYPLNKKAAENFLRSKKQINQLYNNCSGKHLAMLSSCLSNNYKINEYLNFNHEHQISIRKIFEEFTNSKITKKNYGIDGCSAPQYSFNIKDLSNGLNNLIKSYNGLFNFSNEAKLLINSVLENPYYIGGTDSLDSNIIKFSEKQIFCKGGAEGVFLFAHLKKKITGVIKVIDGNERALPSIVYNIFKKLKLFDNIQLKKLKKWSSFQILNHAKINIGSIETKILK